MFLCVCECVCVCVCATCVCVCVRGGGGWCVRAGQSVTLSRSRRGVMGRVGNAIFV